MKKTTLFLLLFVSVLSYSQSTKMKAYLEQTETVTFEQYDLIKKVNQFYSDIIISKTIKNSYTDDLKEHLLIESHLVYEIPTDCTSYSVLIYPDNSRMDYFYNHKEYGFIYGNITVFNGSVYRTLFNVKDNKRVSRYYIDGKLINEIKI